MLKLFNKLLSKLPANGKKSAIGAVAIALAWFLPGFPVGEAELNKIIEHGGYFYLIAGLVHKYLKEKLA